MSGQLGRAQQYFSKAWSHAHQIGNDVDPNLKSCLIYLSSALLSLTDAMADKEQNETQQRDHDRAVSGHPGGGNLR